MLPKRWTITWLLAAGLLIGCDSRQTVAKKSAPAPQTTTPAVDQQTDAGGSTAAMQPATQPALSSQLGIDGQVYKFPAARLRVSKSNRQVQARLFTNDPKAALNDDYSGNRYDLLMDLDDLADPHQIYTAVWQFKARTREYADSPFGIFLQGSKYQLQPFNVTARFIGDMLQVRIDLEGEFLKFDQSDASTPPKSVYVKGFLLAPVEYKD